MLEGPEVESHTQDAWWLMKIFLLFSAYVCTLAAGCHRFRGNTEIHFLLPDGYQGAVRLVVDEQGQVLTASNDTVTLTVPESGILHVKSLGPLRKWHKEFAVYIDGTHLPEGDWNTTSADTIAFWSLGEHGHSPRRKVEALFYVGTKMEADEFIRQIRSPAKLPAVPGASVSG